MGTRSDIIVKLSDGSWKRIYCHWDGYLDHNGEILFRHYNSQERAETLVEPGDLSSLRENCEKPEGHTFDTPAEGYCVYYGRDRGESNAAGRTGQSMEAVWPPDGSWTEYAYVWDGAKWSVADPDCKKQTLFPLSEALEKYEKGENLVKSYVKVPGGVLAKRT